MGFLLSCDGDLREPLVVPQGSQASFPVVMGTSGLLSRCCRGIGPHVELRQETQGSSPVVTEILRFLPSFNRGVSPRLVLRHGTPLSSGVVKWVFGLLLSSGWAEGVGRLGFFKRCNRGVRLPFVCEGTVGVP